MKKETYNKVMVISVLLKEKLKELSECQIEKENILNWIDELTNEGKLEENQKIINERLNLSLERYTKIVNEIKELNKKIK